MSTERFPCKTAGCPHTILPSTAEETGGFCQPCVQAVRRAKHQQWVAANRKDIDPFKGITDPVDVILTYHQDRPWNELIRYLPLDRTLSAVYAELDQAGIERLIDHVVALASPEHDSTRDDLLRELIAYTDANIDRALLAITAHGEFYPAMAFRRAGAEVRQRVLTATQIHNEHALVALAWINHAETRQRFVEWHAEPPAYQERLYVAANTYSTEGGWAVSADGGIIPLHLSTCWALVPPAGAPDAACQVGVPASQSCPQCGSLLTDLLVIDRHDERMANIPWPSDALRVRTCMLCTCGAPVFMQHTMGAEPQWAGPIETREATDPGEWQPVPHGSLTLSGHPRNPMAGASDSLPDPLSQIGGLPAWVQDSCYLPCPKCQKPMTFIGQISLEDVQEYGEGMYYALICPDCRVTGTTYQQT